MPEPFVTPAPPIKKESYSKRDEISYLTQRQQKAVFESSSPKLSPPASNWLVSITDSLPNPICIQCSQIKGKQPKLKKYFA